MFMTMAEMQRHHADLDRVIDDVDDEQHDVLFHERLAIRDRLLSMKPETIADCRALLALALELMAGDPAISAEDIEAAIEAADAGLECIGKAS